MQVRQAVADNDVSQSYHAVADFHSGTDCDIGTGFFGNRGVLQHCTDRSAPDAEVPGANRADVGIDMLVIDGCRCVISGRTLKIRHSETYVLACDSPNGNGGRGGCGIAVGESKNAGEVHAVPGVRFHRQECARPFDIHPAKVYSLSFEQHLRGYCGAYLPDVQEGVAGCIPCIEFVGGVRVVVYYQDIFEGYGARCLEVDGCEINASAQPVGIARNQFAYKPVLNLGRLDGHCCRCQQQYDESEDPGRYVIVPFRVRTFIVIYKNKK